MTIETLIEAEFIATQTARLANIQNHLANGGTVLLSGVDSHGNRMRELCRSGDAFNAWLSPTLGVIADSAELGTLLNIDIVSDTFKLWDRLPITHTSAAETAGYDFGEARWYQVSDNELMDAAKLSGNVYAFLRAVKITWDERRKRAMMEIHPSRIIHWPT